MLRLKLEIRNTKIETNSKCEKGKIRNRFPPVYSFPHSNLFRISRFEFRIWLRPPAAPRPTMPRNAPAINRGKEIGRIRRDWTDRGVELPEFCALQGPHNALPSLFVMQGGLNNSGLKYYAHRREGDGTGEVPRPYPHLHYCQHAVQRLVDQFNEDEQQFRTRETLLLRIINRMADMKKNGRRRSEETIDRLVEAQANDDSAWTRPVRVPRAARRLASTGRDLGGECGDRKKTILPHSFPSEETS